MANVLALHSVGNSIITYLRNTYPQQVAGIAMPACSFDLVSCSQLATTADDTTRITLLLYRVMVNEHARQNRAATRSSDGPASLSLDLHYMLTAWGGTSLDEQLTFAWALRQLHEHPVLDASALSPEAGWAPDEVIQIVPAELSTEDMMRVWDGFEASYRLSSTYVARLVRLDPDQVIESRRVVARQLAFGEEAVS
jgi:Pvc16 N-terminal domain